jgi:hypothetical protein
MRFKFLGCITSGAWGEGNNTNFLPYNHSLDTPRPSLHQKKKKNILSSAPTTHETKKQLGSRQQLGHVVIIL